MTDAPVACPECGGEMVLREGKFGSFYGCRSYPTCVGSMNITKAMAEKTVDSTTKMDRVKAIAAFSRFCKAHGWTSAQGAKWIRDTMGVNRDETQISLFSSKQCELLHAYIKLEENPSSETEMKMAMRKANQNKGRFLRNQF
jgi:ssDNA-binding Zn-finger/Zn-ribbon topoisomerase 1